jgi:hypothetical protein
MQAKLTKDCQLGKLITAVKLLTEGHVQGDTERLLEPLLGTGGLVNCCALEEDVGKVGVVELEVSLVVELEEGGGEGVVVLEVEVVDLRLGCGVTAVLTHVHLQQKITGVKLQPHIARKIVLLVFRETVRSFFAHFYLQILFFFYKSYRNFHAISHFFTYFKT